jgi:hypothetical protein
VGVYLLGAPKPAGAARPTLVIETYLDFCCPFSKKMFDTLYADVALSDFGGQVTWLFQCVPQPWHPQSAYMHEVALAVKAVDEAHFFASAYALFAEQEQFFDDRTADKTRNQIYDELVAVVAAACYDERGYLDAAAVRSSVALAGPGNAGNAVTQVGNTGQGGCSNRYFEY